MATADGNGDDADASAEQSMVSVVASDEVHLDSTESNLEREKKDAEQSISTPAAWPFSPPRSQKRGRALPTSSTRTCSSSRKSPRHKETSDVSEFSDDYDEDEAEAFLSTSSNLAYNWDALGLGHDLGSAALNRYMARYNENSPQLSAQQALQIVNSLQLHTIMPPEFSALHRIIQRVRRHY
jgi:hypothetical protein